MVINTGSYTVRSVGYGCCGDDSEGIGRVMGLIICSVIVFVVACILAWLVERRQYPDSWW